MKDWIAFFSQTGNEINNLSNSLGIYPDAIATNKQDTDGVNKNLIETTAFREHKLNRTVWYTLPQKPNVENYNNILSCFDNPVITLHGYLRIIPKEICEKYEIYNLHPGLITKYPELKGYNPQERAFTGGYRTAGCVIHRVTPGVDEGPIVREDEISIDTCSLDEVYKKLHELAFDMWKSFLPTLKS